MAHNASGLTASADRPPVPHPSVPGAGAARFAEACRAALTDPWLAALPSVGSVDQVVDSTPVLSSIGTARRLRALYGVP